MTRTVRPTTNIANGISQAVWRESNFFGEEVPIANKILLWFFSLIEKFRFFRTKDWLKFIWGLRAQRIREKQFVRVIYFRMRFNEPSRPEPYSSLRVCALL
jgi:hypothetical protein